MSSTSTIPNLLSIPPSFQLCFSPVMPKATRATSPALQKSPFVFIYDGKRVLGMRPSCYNSAVTMCRELFPGIPADSTISFHTRELEACDGQLAEVSERFWEELIGSLKSMIVMTEDSMFQRRSASKASILTDRRTSLPSTKSASMASASTNLPLTIRLVDGTQFSVKVSGLHTISRIQASLANRFDKNAAEHCLIYRGCALSASQTVEEHGLKEGEVLEYRQMPMARAPALYLLAPGPDVIEASVTLSLSPHCTLSAAYPMVSIRPRTANSSESVKWDVNIHPSGLITERKSKLNVPYLSWEAHKQSPTPILGSYPSPEQGCRDEPQSFDPNKVVVDNENSVVLPTAKMNLYLDQTLNYLGVHAAARNVFIAAWMPALLKYKHVALRFLPKDLCTQSAPLYVFPLPDVVTRISIFFRGIPDNDLANWSLDTNNRRPLDSRWWSDVAGIDVRRALDPGLFRVLELSGMDISPS